MNDRYLYRAKRINNGKWVEGYLFDDGFKNGRMFVGGLVIEEYHGTACDDWSITGIDFYEVDPSTICQCTGLRDKNGKLIYEENIVRYEEGSVGIVEFGVWNYYCRGFYIRWLSGNAKCYRNELGYWAPKVEIIGSAFDNTELLEVG